MEKTKIKIAFLSTYPPRECGIATFTKSLINLFDSLYVKNQVKVVAISDKVGAYKYSPRVAFEINQFDRSSYIEAAEFINASKIEVVSIQHEYGIFGGKHGDYILDFMENVTKPIVLSLHSVLIKHDKDRLRTTQRMLDLADSVVVMTNLCKKMLLDKFSIEPNKINIVPHGVPNVRFDEKEEAKELIGLGGKKVLSTFGLLGPGKGIELAIESLAKIVPKNNDLYYLIIGATHPSVISSEGESYRYKLVQNVNRLGLGKQIIFINKYLDYEELVEYLKATDIYLAPQKDLNQAVSGTVSYALGCGAAVVSTKTNFSKEMLASGRGVLVDSDPREMAFEIYKLVTYQDLLKKYQLTGYSFARNMDFPSVSLKFLKVLEANLLKRTDRWQLQLPDFELPPDLSHLERLTDAVGIVQHAKGSLPDYNFGYSIDDQSRALIAVKLLMDQFGRTKKLYKLFKIYLNFFQRIVDEEGVIHNYLNDRGEIIDDDSGEIPVSRGFWALSVALKSKYISEDDKRLIKSFIGIFSRRLTSSSVNAKGYNILGYVNLGKKKQVVELADDLVARFDKLKEKSEGSWRWFDKEMTWANALAPYALIRAYGKTRNKKYINVALDALGFFEMNCSKDGVPCPVGQKGWFVKGKEKAQFDQQPIEAADTVWLYNELYQLSKNEKYLQKAREWMGWYYGNNIKSRMIFDKQTGGVRDGLAENSVNENQGAESIVTYLIAHLSFLNKIS